MPFLKDFQCLRIRYKQTGLESKGRITPKEYDTPSAKEFCLERDSQRHLAKQGYPMKRLGVSGKSSHHLTAVRFAEAQKHAANCQNRFTGLRIPIACC